MIEYRITTHNDKILNEFWKEDWQLIQILDNKMYWSRPVKKTRTIKNKEPQKPVTTYFSELVVKGHCSYYKDIEEQYFEWVKVRADCGKFKPFNESSEKSAWKKLWKHPKPVAERMLEVASAQSYGMLYDLSESDVSKIMEPLRQEKQKEEMKLQWFVSEEDKQKAEREKQRIQQYIINNPSIKEQARLFVEEKHSSLSGMYKDKMITARIAKIAKDNLDNNK